jgi:hypothetical protein
MHIVSNKNDLGQAISTYPAMYAETDKAAILHDLLLSVENDGAVYEALQTADKYEIYSALYQFEGDFLAMYADDDIDVEITEPVYDMLITFLSAD